MNYDQAKEAVSRGENVALVTRDATGQHWRATEPAQTAIWKLWRVLAPLAAQRAEGIEIKVKDGAACVRTVYAPLYGAVEVWVDGDTGQLSWCSEQSAPDLPAPTFDDDWWRTGNWRMPLEVPTRKDSTEPEPAQLPAVTAEEGAPALLGAFASVRIGALQSGAVRPAGKVMR